jgi:hypothetical protein
MHSFLRPVPTPPLRRGFWAAFKLRCFGTGWFVAVTAWLGCTLPAVVLAMGSAAVPGTPSPCSVMGDAYPASSAHAPLHTVLPGIAVRDPH